MRPMSAAWPWCLAACATSAIETNPGAHEKSGLLAAFFMGKGAGYFASSLNT